MENTEIPKKSRSLDLKSLYQSKSSKEAKIKNLKRKGGADVVGVEKIHEKKKGRKDVAISSFRKVNGNGSKSLEEVYNGRLSSGSHDSKDSKLGLNHWLNEGSRLSISQTLECSFSKIPRRKRGFVGRKKVENAGQVSKAPGQASAILENVNEDAKLTGKGLCKQAESLKAKQTGADGLEERRNGHFEEKDGNAGHSVKKSTESSLDKPNTGLSVENVSNSSLKTSHRKRSRKKKELVAVSKGAVELVEPSTDLTVKKNDHLRDDDEENLEENAAMMLSSRFDPNCTGFSSNSKASAVPSSNDLSLLLSSDHEFVAHGANYVSGSESVDVAGRVLRPRNQNREKGNSRKRRHYYEVFSGNLDAYWVLNRRIKVFWPLDKSWYYGLVSGYDKLKKLHHVRYDDRDEEWIDLHNERFKLLLFPSEVPGKVQRKRTTTLKLSNGEKGKPKLNKEKRDLSTEGDSYAGNHLDSEPIISWLARSTHRAKSSSHHALKKRKTSGLSTPVESLQLDEAVRHKCAGGGSLTQEKTNVALPDNFASKGGSAEVCHLETKLCNAKKFSLVYQRRKLGNTSKILCHAFRGFSTGVLESDASFRGLNPDRDLEMSRRCKAFWMADDSGLLKLNLKLAESRNFRLEFSLAVPFISNHLFVADHSLFFHALFLFNYGTLITMWPRVQLEMLFVDDVAGLRFAKFEGCLKRAIAFLLQVLAVCHQPTEHGKFSDLQLPVTSIKFKFSCIEDMRKQLVFAFYSFSEVKTSKWVDLDSTLRRHCLLTKQLPLSECTYDNFKALRNGSSQFLTSSVYCDLITKGKKWRFDHSKTIELGASPKSSVHRDKSSIGSQSLLNSLTVEVSSDNQLDKHVEKDSLGTPHSADLSWKMNGGVIPSPNPTARRSTWHRNRSGSTSFGYLAHGWSEGRGDHFQNNFSNGPKKPRTQVSYALPFGGLDYDSKNKSHFQKGIPNKRIRTANEKRPSEVSRFSGKNLELLPCEANVLITLGDRGWRESGIQIVLELFDHEWKLAVKLSGTTKYSYKAHQFLQPGSTNRYTHAMMWKGGKDWILEFPDRSQWALFKELHEECYNRNIRAALVKNIPIPGVRLIEDNDEDGIEVPFVRSSKYFRQLETDVEIALDPSRVLYDMDGDDEEWLLKNRTSLEVAIGSPHLILEEMFEKTMDLFEKAAYSQHHEEFTSEEIEVLIAGVGPMEAINIIYEYWRQKRQSSGMPLIRHLQPPQWEKYQKQVKEWELTMSKCDTAPPNGCHEKVGPWEKPPMYAFCLKPRGLEVPNKGFKHRSQRKISVSVHGNTFSGYHDAFHSYGRRLNGFAFSDYQGHNFEHFDDSPLPQISPRLFSPRDTVGKGYYGHSDRYDRLRRKTKKPGGTYMFDKRNRFISPWNSMDLSSDWPTQRHYYLEGSPSYLGHEHGLFDNCDLDELRMRDATSAAKHALNVAKFKRDKAQRLLFRADLAIHKAVVALMTAEAIKTSSADINGDG